MPHQIQPGQGVVYEQLQTRRLFVLVLALGLFVMAARSVTDPDIWWHLRTGELIFQTHHIPRTDPYSFTKDGQPWIDHEWLSQILLYGTYKFTGWSGLIMEFAAIIGVAFGILFLRSPGRPYVAGAITAWGAMASIPSWGVRPQMLTLLLASVFLLILDRSYERPKLLWWTPPLMLLWINLHAGYALGIALLALYLAGSGLDLAFGQSDMPNPTLWFRRMVMVSIFCIAIVPLNPYGTRLYSYPFETLRSPAMSGMIAEWLSPNFHLGRNLPALLMILTLLLLGAMSPKNLRPRELLLISVTLYAGLRSVRHIPIFILVAVPIISGMIQAWLETREVAIFAAQPSAMTRAKLALNVLLLAGMISFTGARLHYVVLHQKQAEAREFPAAAAVFIATTHPAAPLLNHYNWGGYFIWKLYPEYKVFIDGRADVYGDAFMDEFASTYYLQGPSWQAPLEKWNIRTIALPPDAPLATALQSTPGWKTVFSDQQAVVLRR